MKKTDALRFYENSPRKLATALGISTQAVTQWGDIVPASSAVQIQVITRGRVKVDFSLYKGRKPGPKS